MTNRYDASGSTEGQYQPGSGGRVLRNKLGITDPREMDQVELDLLEQLYDKILSDVTQDQTITVADLKEWHRTWLGNVYEWAGQERSVNMAKGTFQFASATQIPRLLAELDQKYLGIHTPCWRYDENQLVKAIAVVHVELILIHPFREGNGRLARLLANVMALQAGWPELDFKAWDLAKEKYFAAIQVGLGCDYKPLEVLVRQVLHDSESAAS